MYKTLRWIIVCAILLPILLVSAALALAFYSIEDEPLVDRSAPVDYETVLAGKALLKRIKREIESADERGITLAISEEELGHLAQMGSHTFEWLKTDLIFERASINSRMSVHLIPNPFGEYLNVVVQIGQSDDGIGVDRLSIGPLEFSGRWLLPLAARLADTVLADKQASLLLASVSGIRIQGNKALLDVVPPPNVKAQLKKAVRTLQASRLPPGEEERVVHYYDLLVRMGAPAGQRSHSFSPYLTLLMGEAANRQARSSAVAENRAVIWAIVIYFSDGAFEALLGKLVSSHRPLASSPSGVTLGGRQDLMAHFLYSAGIALATQQGIGIAAGEFKELMDSGTGGSGFSFADLAADRTGIEFVTVATASEFDARRLQERLSANNGESAFFPDLSGLIEGLSDAQFSQRYGSTQSQRYREQVAVIDQRIASLPIYQDIFKPLPPPASG